LTRPLRFTVPGRPRPKERPRLGGRSAATGRVVFYTPRATREWERAVAAYALAARQAWADGKASWPLDRAYGISVAVYCARRPWPDGSNVLKAVEDACNKILYADDRQVLRASCAMRAAPGPDAERVEVVVRILPGPGNRRQRPAQEDRA